MWCRITRRKFDWRRRTYITRDQVKLIQSMFEITSIKRTFYPPIVFVSWTQTEHRLSGGLLRVDLETAGKKTPARARP